MKQLAILLIVCMTFLPGVYGKTIIVSNNTELQAANMAATPGDVIIMKNGNWKDCEIMLTCKGTAEKPVHIRAESSGKVILSDKSYLRIGGDHVVVEGLRFIDGAAPKGSVWEFKAGKALATNCRITNCLIDSYNNKDKFDENYWVALHGKNNRMDHCGFLNKTNIGVLLAVILDDEQSRDNHHSIDSNYFGIRKPLGSNGGEIIRVGISQHCTFYSNTVISNNLFERCDGETEIISIKSCGNTLRNNVFKECQGALVLRHGNNNTIEGNIFWGNGKEGSGGVRVINEGNWIVNNLFIRCAGEGFRSPLAIMNGVPNSPPHRYLPVRDAVIANNTFVNCAPLSFGEGADAERSVAPANVYCFNNIFYGNTQKQLYYVYSSVDSLYFSGNITSKNFSTTTKGFSREALSLQKVGAIDLPAAMTATTGYALPDSLKQQEKSRLQQSLSAKAGCTNPALFKTLFANANKMGVQWKTPVMNAISKYNKIISCKNAAEIYKVLLTGMSDITILLTGSEYVFDRPVIIKNNVTLKGNKAYVDFKSNSQLKTVFSVTENSRLNLEQIDLNMPDLKTDCFILADSVGNNIHFSVNINRCRLNNFSATAFYHGAKKSYASAITVSNCIFFLFNANLFVLKDETDKKGYYNAENITITNSQFHDGNGKILDVARTGSDESTMGPRLIFTGNTAEDWVGVEALLELSGVQQSHISQNSFKNCNNQGILIRYTDSVRARHILQKNTLARSGEIVENKFVQHIK
jgi:poly(beta-D-mannuronate) lyase